jgi:hypothetical protein
MKQILRFACVIGACGLAHAVPVNTADPGAIAAFQAGATVNTLESVPTRTPQAITSYTTGDPVGATAYVFDQIPGAQFSVGGQPGVNMPALFSLGGSIAGDARSASTVLAPTGMQDGTTSFTAGVFMEVFFPVKVSRVGFFLNPSLDNVSMIATDTNFAFSGLPETNLETGNGTAGNFVGFSRPTADIGGLKIFTTGTEGFSLDDLTLAGAATAPIPEPTTWMMLLGGLASLAVLRRRRE